MLLLIGGGTWLVQRFLWPSKPQALEVVSVKGDVAVVGAKGETAMTAGGRILPGEKVRTGHEGEAVLRGAGSSTITLSEHTQVSVAGVVDGVARLSLDEGQVRSKVNATEGNGVEVKGGDGATVLTRGGDVAVGIDGQGNLAVATFEGNASLTHGGATRDVGAGQIAIVAGGKVEVGAVPTSVLLKVAWPEAGKTKETTTKVQVELPKGATARVNGQPVRFGADGTAIAEVRLEEGENRIKLEARDIAGNQRTEESGVIILDTRKPDISGGKIDWKQ